MDNPGTSEQTSGRETAVATRPPADSGIGGSPLRPDGILKAKGAFAYASDLWADDMLWGATLRSPHPRARIVSVDLGEALATPGVEAVLTHEDIPGRNLYGLETADTPVLAAGEVRYHGEPVAIVAADHPETARRAAARIKVAYEVLDPVVTEEQALAAGAPVVNPHWPDNIVSRQPVRRGDPDRATADVVVRGRYTVGMQDQAPLGPEAALAVPAEDGGVDLFVATQFLHVDRQQLAPVLGLPEEKVRLTLGGVGGAFGAREDLTLQAHACLLALHTGKPVKMVYSREESFLGHVHRHPAVMDYEHGADRDGRLVYVKARVVLDGGAYASTTAAVVGNAAGLGIGPYHVPHIATEAIGLVTNNPPCGAMRGFGAVQACFAYESQMDRLAAELGLHPVEFRQRNALAEGGVTAIGQVLDSPAPVAELLGMVRAMPLPGEASGTGGRPDPRELPGGYSWSTRGEGVRRGIGYSVGVKNVAFSQGHDDYSTARVRLEAVAGEPVATVHTAAAEVGQGGVAVWTQIARTELGVERVVLETPDTQVGSAGSTSASRQTYVTGGAVRDACRLVREEVLRLAGRPGNCLLRGGKVTAADGLALDDLADVLDGHTVEHTAEYRHRATSALDPETGQGDAFVQYTFCAHRAVVDVDVELGLVKVVELAAAQDVGRAMNPQAVAGQIQGGGMQGMGLALTEEIVVRGGVVVNGSFTDYLIPTIADAPAMPVQILELADPHAPYGLRGVGEAPTVSAAPAVVAAIRDATGKALARIPIRPEDLLGD
ncbi:xanthine dehydrogenase family protein molybdopterin-binding subunit [Yinghuangia soli]|uniref:Molybdopterin-dependent oxidoreductase n=1 Tax=Yinghuangia soli TaxID=2908204 RepID=A0AA41PUN3_9ACTN|nr:molybdopterin cofactor-binding domain-containing protein [Yinghuangia soli]MCF2525635.1 molybdopterin-dependent oxidoreductase [Yinghuangia soli]